MRRAYKFRLRPTARQHLALQECLDAHRALYNAALEERRGRWRWNRESVSYGDQSAQLRGIRNVCPEQGRWSFSSQQATLRRLNRAFAAFFRRCAAGEKPGYPRFRSEHRFNSVEWPKDGDGCRWKPEHRRVYLQGVGDVKADTHRPVDGLVKTISVKREGRRWFLVLSCDKVATRPLPPTGRAVGIDLGVSLFLATSDGDLVDNPRHGRRAARRLAAAQAALAHKQRGSNNRRRQRSVVANRHRKTANRRRAYHHQIARRLVDRYDILVVEDLSVANMCRSAFRHPRAARCQRRRQTRPQSFDPRRGLGTVRLDPRRQSGRSWPVRDQGGPPAHQPDVRRLSPRRRQQPRQPSRVPMSTLRTHRPRRRQRGSQHPQGWTGPSGNRCCLKRSWRLEPSEKSLISKDSKPDGRRSGM